jgi:hypothetical protein
LILGLHLLLLFTLFGLILGIIPIKAVNYGLVYLLDDVFFEYALNLHEVMLVVLTQVYCILVCFAWGGGLRLTVGSFSLDLAINVLVAEIVLLSEVRVVKVLFRGF